MEKCILSYAWTARHITGRLRIGFFEGGERMRPWRTWSGFVAEDLNPGRPRVELTGDRRVYIERHRGVLEYSDTAMRIALEGGELCVTGCRLELAALSLTELTIEGDVRMLEYKRKA